MRRFLKHIGSVFLGFFVLAQLISYISLWGLRQGSFYKPSFLENSVKGNHFDYIVIGASTGLTTINTKVVDSVLQTTGLNLSMDDTALSSQYLMLQHFLASGKRTDVCVLSASVIDYDVSDYRLSGNDYRFLPYVSKDYIRDYYCSFYSFQARLLAYSEWVPMLGFGYYNSELFYPALWSFIEPEKRIRFDGNGNYTYPVGKDDSKPIEYRTLLPVYLKNDYLNKIRALCEANNIQLVCYMAPLKSREAVVRSSAYKLINHTAILDDTHYFYDEVHVNALGRQLVSIQFAKELQLFLE